MKPYVLKREQFVPRPLADVFPFFAKPENLAKITPGSLGFDILTPSPVPMRRGTLIDYTIHMMGLPMHWRSMISSYDPPHLFVDEQLQGPYAFWHHTHRFEEVEGGTMVHDEVRYLLPFGVLGRIVHTFFVRRRLNAIFDYREKVIAERFGRAAR